MFRLEVTGNFVSERENVDEDICAMGGGAFKVEVDPDAAARPEKSRRSTPPRSTTSASGSTACRWPSNGSPLISPLRPGRHPQGAAGYDITFLHPKANDEFPIGGEGVLIELVQARRK